ncbi:hypothetical protein SKAU_G00060050 [Synaphobranchus kaupii]|uniref:Eukaryotic translation initiation factor 4G n=1 Tax=Synaphobranchus kaupii TaxID=118154 RepID=A0A9Q1G648_SYNKA|nr:hypothetical protein SKAU_G00060050 [Synaphobranchus kaupii]
MLSILNKLTPEVFQFLAKHVSELNIDTEEHLRGVAAIVHEKAIAEGKFATIYAQLCHCLRERDNWRHGGKDLQVNEEPHPAWRHSLKEELPRAENVWKTAVKRLIEGGRDRREEDPETARSQELFQNMCLDKLTPEIFRHLMEEVNKFPINTEEDCLQGIAALIFEKAISEERFTATCAKMCHCLREASTSIKAFSLLQKLLFIRQVTCHLHFKNRGRRN